MPTVQQEVQQANKAFGRALADFADRSGVSMWDAVRKATLDLMRDIMLDTPVDTGRARAGWTAIFREFRERAPSIPGRNAKARAEGRALSRAEVRLQERTIHIGPWGRRVKDAGEIRIQNRVPYVIFLERGWSGQAPAGMVQVNLYRHAQYYRRALRGAEAQG